MVNNAWDSCFLYAFLTWCLDTGLNYLRVVLPSSAFDLTETTVLKRKDKGHVNNTRI